MFFNRSTCFAAIHDGVENEAEGANLFFVSPLEPTADLAAFAVVNAPAEAMARFRMVELGQDAPAERHVVDVAQDVDRYADPADFGERACAKVVGFSFTRRLRMMPAALSYPSLFRSAAQAK
jgi:hypothetical protein